ncbi:Eukaryotic translation initiation factor 1A, X-chromosomal [Apostichopus japonicus]|uniref:Eukaryotic translation initiation factor 4C n=1 Tax=Stichopus japonicus TaxID=307972 RepID=A0A2G8KJ22_STIJA|nr:Eukaryotic translation initiation factor 1A, X-chromosomal [Apostichopus japonicus]
MGEKIRKGGKNRRRGKNENESEKRELVFKDDGQEYAQVLKMLGNGRLEAQCFDGVKRLCHIRGKLRKKVSLDQHIGHHSRRSSGLPRRQGGRDSEIQRRRGPQSEGYGELPNSCKINETTMYGENEEEDDITFDLDYDDIKETMILKAFSLPNLHRSSVTFGNYRQCNFVWKIALSSSAL